MKNNTIVLEENINRHELLEWNLIEERLKSNIGKLWILSEMERNGNCSFESPIGRRDGYRNLD